MHFLFCCCTLQDYFHQLKSELSYLSSFRLSNYFYNSWPLMSQVVPIVAILPVSLFPKGWSWPQGCIPEKQYSLESTGAQMCGVKGLFCHHRQTLELQGEPALPEQPPLFLKMCGSSSLHLGSQRFPGFCCRGINPQ